MDTGLKTDYSLSEKDKKLIEEFKKKLPKYKTIRYTDYICFGGGGGIGLGVQYRREYNNGKVFKLDISDYDSW